MKQNTVRIRVDPTFIERITYFRNLGREQGIELTTPQITQLFSNIIKVETPIIRLETIGRINNIVIKLKVPKKNGGQLI